MTDQLTVPGYDCSIVSTRTWILDPHFGSGFISVRTKMTQNWEKIDAMWSAKVYWSKCYPPPLTAVHLWKMWCFWISWLTKFAMACVCCRLKDIPLLGSPQIKRALMKLSLKSIILPVIKMQRPVVPGSTGLAKSLKTTLDSFQIFITLKISQSSHLSGCWILDLSSAQRNVFRAIMWQKLTFGEMRSSIHLEK